jgi:hypothetical protein
MDEALPEGDDGTLDFDEGINFLFLSVTYRYMC